MPTLFTDPRNLESEFALVDKLIENWHQYKKKQLDKQK